MSTSVIVWRRSLSQPQAFNPYRPVSDIACGSNVCALVTSTGQLFCWDWTTTEVAAPEQSSALQDETVVSLEMGDAHMAVINEKGDLFMLGSNNYGQLGVGTTVPTPDVMRARDLLSSVPYCLDFDAPVISVSCSPSTTLVVVSPGEVFAMGSNIDGALGVGRDAGRIVPNPTSVAFPSGICVKSVAAGAHHSLALTEDDRVFAWGDNTAGALGTDRTSSWTPVEVEPLRDLHVVYIAAAEASVALTAKGEVYVWGCNQWSTPHRLTWPGPRGSQSRPARQVSISKENLLVLTADGTLRVQGIVGGYFDGSPENVTLPEGSNVLRIAAEAGGFVAVVSGAVFERKGRRRAASDAGRREERIEDRGRTDRYRDVDVSPRRRSQKKYTNYVSQMSQSDMADRDDSPVFSVGLPETTHLNKDPFMHKHELMVQQYAADLKKLGNSLTEEKRGKAAAERQLKDAKWEHDMLVDKNKKEMLALRKELSDMESRMKQSRESVDQEFNQRMNLQARHTEEMNRLGMENKKLRSKIENDEIVYKRTSMEHGRMVEKNKHLVLTNDRLQEQLQEKESIIARMEMDISELTHNLKSEKSKNIRSQVDHGEFQARLRQQEDSYTRDQEVVGRLKRVMHIGDGSPQDVVEEIAKMAEKYRQMKNMFN